MWLDAETSIDYVNFGSVAESVAELIVQADGEPLSIGVSGPWGVGKSSLIRLTRLALDERQPKPPQEGAETLEKYVFVEFNAWLYQGYDDARAALLETIAAKLSEVAEERQTGVEKTHEFLRRIDWFRFASLTAGSAAAIAMGLPPVGLFGQAAALFKRGQTDGVDQKLIEDTQKTAEDGAQKVKGLIKDPPPMSDESPRERIQALRDSFEAALKELDVTLVVLIDDLDRCLPETAVSTLEAIRLFLFLKGTAFVIAADDQMIKHAVRKHFDNPDESLVSNYFDKLIQIPIRVPTLGTQEVRAYMFLLYVQNSDLSEPDREKIRSAVCERLGESWKGLRIDRAFVEGVGVKLPNALVAQLDTADRLTTLMATASEIAGNPRLIKRFLNALSVRMAVANRQGVSVDEAALAKLLLFERLAPTELYLELATSITTSVDGKPHILDGLEPDDTAQTTADTVAGVEPESDASGVGVSSDVSPAVTPPERWATSFTKEWLALPPRLADIDMRGALYVSREHLPILTREDGLSSTAAELLRALIEHPTEAGALEEQIAALGSGEQSRMLDRLLAVARAEEQWGVPSILEALLVVVRIVPSLGSSLAGFLGSRPHNQIEADLIPRIADEPWAAQLMTSWAGSAQVSGPVKVTINRRTGNGNVAK